MEILSTYYYWKTVESTKPTGQSIIMQVHNTYVWDASGGIAV